MSDNQKYVEEGGSLCMIGGYMSFTGIDGTARYGQTEIADVLPVEMLDIDDRVEAPQGLVPELIEEHEAVSGLEGEWYICSDIIKRLQNQMQKH